ncbi:MAG: DNA mismatch repair protein MutS, partial [Pseudomonadota bacterium]
MTSTIKSIDIWRDSLILSSNDQPTHSGNIQPSETDYTVLDPKTYEAIEAEKLFNQINQTKT